MFQRANMQACKVCLEPVICCFGSGAMLIDQEIGKREPGRYFSRIRYYTKPSSVTASSHQTSRVTTAPQRVNPIFTLTQPATPLLADVVLLDLALLEVLLPALVPVGTEL
jgi:hypothetical protein